MIKLIIGIVVFAGCYLFVPEYKTQTSDTHVEDRTEETTEDVKPVVENKSTIECQLADWCGPCKAFKRSGAIKELEAKGWTIKYVDGIGKSYPSFRVTVNGKSQTFSGYSNKSAFYRKVRQIKERLSR